MAGFNFGQFAGNFMQAFTQAQAAKQQQALQKDELKYRTKLYELQLKKEQMGLSEAEKTAQARDELFAQLTPQQIPNPTPPLIRAPGASETVQGPAPTLTELLADPQSTMLLLRSGMLKPDDLLAQESNRANRAMLERFMGGGAPAGMELTKIGLDPSGRPMLDFERPRAWQEVPSPDGRSRITLDRQGRPIGSRPAAPSEMPQPTEEDKRQRDIKTAMDLYEQAKQGLLSGLTGTATGPLIGRLPAITSKQQTAQGSVAAMAPVLKQLFRAAGEGVFTDKDQELLIAMIPTRETNPEARRAMLENIDAIVRAKLGMGTQSNVVDFNQLPP